jgi:dihydroxyacid dehydratase/phosphogluconate dehydratase
MLSRKLVSMDVDRDHPIDGVVLMCGGDKTPSLTMGAASCDLPAIVVSGGPMPNGEISWERYRIRHRRLAIQRGVAGRNDDAKRLGLDGYTIGTDKDNTSSAKRRPKGLHRNRVVLDLAIQKGCPSGHSGG